MRYTLDLEVQDDGTTMAHVRELIGCISSGVTQEVAVARAPDAIAGWNAWLRSHNAPAAPENEPIEIVVGSSIADADTHLGDEAGLLPADRVAVSEQEVAQLMQLMAYSRRDLINLITGLSREVLHWQPQTEVSADGWCIDDILEHLARAERVYASRLSSNIFDLIEEARRAALERMARLTEAERSQITEHQGEYWTARKVFRRFLEHEHEHYQHIDQVLHQFSANQGVR